MPTWLIWVLIAVTWFPAGYFGARFGNALIWYGHPHKSWETCSCRTFMWNRPVRSDGERGKFGVAVFSGWITVALALFVLLLYAVMLALAWFFTRVGQLVAPKG